MKKAIVYGAGNIGRGFIGAKLSESGYEVVFIDIAEAVINKLNEDRQYCVEIIGDQCIEKKIFNVRGVNAKDEELAIHEIASADLIATSVGANVLKFIAPVLARAIEIRAEDKAPALDILICENLNHADRILRDLLLNEIKDSAKVYLESQVGLVETSIGCMVPVMTPEKQAGDLLKVCVESYNFLPVDRAAFRGDIPNIERLIPYTPFEFYLHRKLFLHNMGHAMTAYLGDQFNCEYIWQAIEMPVIRLCVEKAMIESAIALSKKYQIFFSGLYAHIDDLILRFSNHELADTVARVGRDPLRKLQKDDRLIGAARACVGEGIFPAYISLGIAAALCFYQKTENNLLESSNAYEQIIREMKESLSESQFDMIILLQKDLLEKKPLEEIVISIEKKKCEVRGPIA